MCVCVNSEWHNFTLCSQLNRTVFDQGSQASSYVYATVIIALFIREFQTYWFKACVKMLRIKKPVSLEDQLWENACELVGSAVTDVIATQIQSMEKELDNDKLNTKLYGFLMKANKTAGASLTAWQTMVEDFVNKFYSLLYQGMSGRVWLERADFSLVCAISIKAWKAEIINAVPQDDYMQHVGTICALAHDNARYYSHAWAIVTKVIDSKVNQKRVRDAVDKAREDAVKTQPANIDAFLPQWIMAAIEALAKESPAKNPKISLPKEKALELFNKLIQEGAGIPLWLESCKPSLSAPEVVQAIDTAYEKYPEPRDRNAPYKGKDKGDGKGGGKGWGKDGGMQDGCQDGMNMFAGMMGMMNMMMGGGGWDGNGGGKGWGPY